MTRYFLNISDFFFLTHLSKGVKSKHFVSFREWKRSRGKISVFFTNPGADFKDFNHSFVRHIISMRYHFYDIFT